MQKTFIDETILPETNFHSDLKTKKYVIACPVCDAEIDVSFLETYSTKDTTTECYLCDTKLIKSSEITITTTVYLNAYEILDKPKKKKAIRKVTKTPVNFNSDDIPF